MDQGPSGSIEKWGRPSRRPGKEPVGDSEGSGEQAVPPPESLAGEASGEPDDNSYWPFCYWDMELDP
ncbi:uncharacterized protein A4U43_C01F20000 [Asparagus officinalis]|uniref:Uncharacterized protein n=1 Tax=Asparagus officinalis TaxID=4686 RepID=A0A5P1FSI5_ASPOF|nr:uncharacterized protein A4U43_C01F20000 [Asparagus officinalis]